jgi:hypothetical protein
MVTFMTSLTILLVAPELFATPAGMLDMKSKQGNHTP